jgi:transposase
MNSLDGRRRAAEIRRLQDENARLRRANAALEREKAATGRENDELKKRIVEQEARILQLQAALEAAQRAGKRQAAPFSKGAPKANPKKPGRKPGADYGAKAHRPPPAPEDIDETYDVPLPDSCPHCGGQVDEAGVDQQYQVEIPRRPIYRQFNVHTGHCTCCGCRVQGRHSLQTSDALGAAASQLGPDAQAAIVFLNKYGGLSHGKIVETFKQLFGISLSRGGSVHVVLRAAQRCQGVYQEIANSVRGSPWAVLDETGWKTGGKKGWLHVAVGDQATLYKIDPTRSADVAARVLGWDYSGTLVHDGWASYDRFREARHQQCVRHVMRRALEMLELAVGGAVHFPREMLMLFKEALRLRDRHEQGQLTENDLADGYLTLSVALQNLVERPRQNQANQTLANHLANHLTEWFWFLLQPGLDATNYRAEQAVRLGVINRKIWGGSRTLAGGHAQEIHMSTIGTCHRQAHPVIDFYHQTLCGAAPRLVPNR